MSRMSALVFAVVLSLTMLPQAVASGSRGLNLTEESLQRFRSTSVDRLATHPLRYIGSTPEWHLFLLVETSTGGGMPFSHLELYRVPVADLTITNGWQANILGQYVAAHSCPSYEVDPDTPGALRISASAATRERCGT